MIYSTKQYKKQQKKHIYHMQGYQFQELLKSSDQISQILDLLKNNLINSSSTPNLHQDPIQFIEKAIDLKMTFRYLVNGIQTNRALVQVQKEQIERKKVFLEGLHYYKATLKNQISNCKIDITNLNDYIEEQPTPQTNWIEDYANEQQKVLRTLQQFKQRKEQYQQKQQNKQQLIRQVSDSRQKYKKIFPQQVNKLYSQVAETSKIFNIKQIDTLSLTQFKSKKIQRIHSLLYPLKLKELIDLKHSNQFDAEELEITIQKGFFDQYQYARQNKILIEEKQIKFYITSVFKTETQFDTDQIMAVSISRREDFSTEEIFNNLFLQQKVKPIYPNPTSQAQRNTNNKYSQLNWISQILASPSSLISGNELIDKIKNRIFNLNILRFALQNVTRKTPPYFFPLFKASEEGSKLSSFANWENKKILITKYEKTTFQQYQKETYIPEWVLKALNRYQILMEEQKLQKLQNNPGSAVSSQRQLLNSYIENNHLQELEIKDFYWYYKFELAVQKSLLTGFILVSNQYPNRKSVIKLVSFKKPTSSQQDITLPNQFSLGLSKYEIQSKSKGYSDELRKWEVQLNNQIEFFLYRSGKNLPESQTRKKQPYLIYFQINRLISLMLEKSLEHN